MRHGSLFSGIGGFDLAAEWAGWENIFHCEINPFGQKVLKYYWPNSIQYHDITKTDFTIHRGTIDVLTGGFPCQPYSQAGKRLGKEDERHLWPEMLRAIREIQPRWVVGENVRGLITWNGGLVFDEVQADLEAAGYEVLPFLLPASGVNAPHERYRIWFVAYAKGYGNRRILSRMEGKNDCDRKPQKYGENNLQFVDNGEKRYVTNTTSDRRIGTGQGIDVKEGLQPRTEQSGQLAGRFEGLRNNGDAADAESIGLQQSGNSRNRRTGFKNCNSNADASNAFNTGLQRNKQRGSHGERNREETFRPTPEPFKIRTWDNWPTEPPVRCYNDGISSRLDGITISKHRNESIKGYGNAIVPQVVYQIFKAINDYQKHAL